MNASTVMNTDTPITDSVKFRIKDRDGEPSNHYAVHEIYARKMERENTQLKNQLRYCLDVIETNLHVENDLQIKLAKRLAAMPNVALCQPASATDSGTCGSREPRREQ